MPWPMLAIPASAGCEHLCLLDVIFRIGRMSMLIMITINIVVIIIIIVIIIVIIRISISINTNISINIVTSHESRPCYGHGQMRTFDSVLSLALRDETHTRSACRPCAEAMLQSSPKQHAWGF